MPVKNTGIYLHDCVQSILNQQFENWELIAVNDHSTDKSYEVLKEYAAKDNRIKVIQNQGNGIIDALKTAYKVSSGEYLTRMDSDDLMTTDKLQLMTDTLQKSGRKHVAIGLVKYFSETHLGEGYKQYAQWLNNLTIAESNFLDIYKECTIPSPCWMIERNDFEQAGGFNSETYPEDYDLAFRFKKCSFSIAKVEQVIHHWRDYDNRTSRTHEHYSDNRFSKLKVFHFLDQDREKSKELILWGAGNKGKQIAQLLIDHGVQFRWICNNKKKIGKDIYGVKLEAMKTLSIESPFQVIVAVSSGHDDDGLSSIINANKNHHYFRFC